LNESSGNSNNNSSKEGKSINGKVHNQIESDDNLADKEDNENLLKRKGDVKSQNSFNQSDN
jgi:hypothetical protein